MIKAPYMLMIGSAGRNIGKTELACSIIEKFRDKHQIIGAKVTTIHESDGKCPRGGDGCGVCSSVEGEYCITEETNAGGDKDTGRLLAAGAQKVYWLRVFEEHMAEGADALLSLIPEEALVVCESNSLRSFIEPGCFLMVRPKGSEAIKESARAVIGHVDRFAVSDGESFDFSLADLEVIGKRWALQSEATAIVMAGGGSERMGSDKSMLDVGGKPLIGHICEQIGPFFKQVLISSNEVENYSFLGLEIVPDRIPGQGPLMGVASALAVSKYDRNFVVACDIPDLDMSVVLYLLRAARSRDGAALSTGQDCFEPMFAVYNKQVLNALEDSLSRGNFKAVDFLNRNDFKFIEISDPGWLKNLNTRQDYEEYVAGT